MNEKKYTNKIYYNSNLQSKTKLPYNEKFQYLNDKDKNLNETTYTQAINNAQNHRTILFNNNSQNCLEETTNRIHNNNHLQSEITNLITTNVNSTLPHNRFKSVPVLTVELNSIASFGSFFIFLSYLRLLK